jgi:hypothetical protein
MGPLGIMTWEQAEKRKVKITINRVTTSLRLVAIFLSSLFWDLVLNSIRFMSFSPLTLPLSPLGRGRG